MKDIQEKNMQFLMDHIIAEIENSISEIVNDQTAPGLHRLQGLIEFLKPGLEAIKERTTQSSNYDRADEVGCYVSLEEKSDKRG
jgi:hypothetical protein